MCSSDLQRKDQLLLAHPPRPLDPEVRRHLDQLTDLLPLEFLEIHVAVLPLEVELTATRFRNHQLCQIPWRGMDARRLRLSPLRKTPGQSPLLTIAIRRPMSSAILDPGLSHLRPLPLGQLPGRALEGSNL